jgi:DNA invertase Pin-like site-specific DNA recombinase
MPKAYSYKRFSSEKQARGDSLRRQKELAEKYVRDNPHLNLELDESLTDEGISAYRGRNREKGALSIFLGMVLTGQIEPGAYLLIENFDRLSRQTPLDALDLLRNLVNNEIVVVTLHDDKRYDKETLTGENAYVPLLTSILAMIRANEESATKGRRVRAAWENKFRQISEGKQLTKRVPFWLNKDRTLLPDRVATVREIFGMYASGVGTYNIARKLNEKKVAPPTARAKFWGTSSVAKVLRSKNAMGSLVTADGQEHKNYYPEVVDESLWQSCQRLTASSKHATGRANSAVLSGLCLCAECGEPARKTIKTGRIRKDGTRGRWETLVCTRAINNAGCPYIGITYQHVINTVLIALGSLQYTPPNSDLLAEIHSLSLGISEFQEDVNLAYAFSMKAKTVDARAQYLKLAKEQEENKKRLDNLLAQHGAIGWEIQEKTLTSILVENKVTNANLRRLIKSIKVDFRSKTLEINTHLNQTLKEDLYPDRGDAL